MREGYDEDGGRECVGCGVGRPMPSLQLRPSLLDVESEGPAQTTTLVPAGALAHAACALRSVPSFQQPSSASTSIGKTTSNKPSPALAVKNTRKLTALIS